MLTKLGFSNNVCTGATTEGGAKGAEAPPPPQSKEKNESKSKNENEKKYHDRSLAGGGWIRP